LKSSSGFNETTFASPNKFRSTGAASTFKTPQRASTSNVKKRGGPLDSNADFGTINQDDSLLKSSSMPDQFNPTQAELSMVNLFREQLELEKRLERVKIDLSLRTDFNLIDAFRIFDTEGKGWISAQEIKDGLALLNIFANADDLHLYLSRYDKDDDGRLRYSEFCDSFLPNDPFNASLLAKKAPLHMYHMQLQRDKIFYAETRELFVLCWNIHL